MSSPRAFSNKSGRAFTLVELLVVIGIIALLVSILLPALNKARKSANQAKCLSNIQQITRSIYMYVQDNQGTFPHPGSYDRTSGTTYVQREWDWIHWQKNRPYGLEGSPVAKYANNLGGEMLKTALRCPEDNVEERMTIPSDSDAAQGKYVYSYSMSNQVMVSETKTYKITDFKRTSNKILFTEETDPNDGRWVPLSTGDRLTMRHGAAMQTTNSITGMQGDRVSAGFVDGHAEVIDQTKADDQRYYSRTYD